MEKMFGLDMVFLQLGAEKIKDNQECFLSAKEIDIDIDI